jgi:hypothetical protein
VRCCLVSSRVTIETVPLNLSMVSDPMLFADGEHDCVQPVTYMEQS